MLTLPRTTTAARRLFLHSRALSTVTHNTGSPDASAEQPSGSAAPDEATENRQRPTHLANSSAECMYVCPWNGIRSSAEGLAIARAVQGKYGPAREVIFPRDPDCVNIFQPYFWLVYDSQDVRKRLPGQSAQIRVHVADLPRSNGNVSIEEMMRALGLSTPENNDAPHEPQAAPEDEASKNASDAPEGYKTLDVRVAWAQNGPGEVLRPKRRLLSPSGQDEATVSKLASAWLAFDGFSPESARGPHTPNLLRAREKWRKLAPAPAAASQSPSSSPFALGVGGDQAASNVAAEVPPSHGPAERRTPESSTKTETEAQAQPNQPIPPLEWIPIPLASQPASSTSPAPQNDTPVTTAAAAAAPDDSNSVLSIPNAPDAADPSVAAPTPTNEPTDANPTEGAHGPRMSRRERILHLARQNARTPLPDFAAKSQQPQPPPPPPPTDEETERQGKERTIRERLWRLVGGNY